MRRAWLGFFVGVLTVIVYWQVLGTELRTTLLRDNSLAVFQSQHATPILAKYDRPGLTNLDESRAPSNQTEFIQNEHVLLKVPMNPAMINFSEDAVSYCPQPHLEGLALSSKLQKMGHVSAIDLGAGFVILYQAHSMGHGGSYIYVSNDFGRSFHAPRISFHGACSNRIDLPKSGHFFSPMLDPRVRERDSSHNILAETARKLFSSTNMNATCYERSLTAPLEPRTLAWWQGCLWKGVGSVGVVSPGGRAFGSNDGVFWEPVAGIVFPTPGLTLSRGRTLGYNDGQWSLLWDRHEGVYRMLFRFNKDLGVRSVQSSMTFGENISQWSEPVESNLSWLGGAPGQNIDYYAALFVSHIQDKKTLGFLGFASRVLKSGVTGLTLLERETQPFLGMDIALVSTRDGSSLHFICDRPMLNNSNVPGAFPNPAKRYAVFPIRGFVKDHNITYFFCLSSMWKHTRIFRFSFPMEDYLGGVSSQGKRTTWIQTNSFIIPATVKALRLHSRPFHRTSFSAQVFVSRNGRAGKPFAWPRLVNRWERGSTIKLSQVHCVDGLNVTQCEVSTLTGERCIFAIAISNGTLFDLEFLAS